MASAAAAKRARLLGDGPGQGSQASARTGPAEQPPGHAPANHGGSTGEGASGGGAGAAGSGEEDGAFRNFARQWQWKREHRPDKERFRRPYLHTLQVPGEQPATLTIAQRQFGPEGFASTVWDGSIVVAKHLERWPQRYAGRRVLDLSAGCGLVGIVAARLGARVTSTDLAPNLDLLAANCEANAPGLIRVLEHRWGEDAAPLEPPFDAICAQDVMYDAEAVPALVASLGALSGPGGEVLVAHGRNRWALGEFLTAVEAAGWEVAALPAAELDPLYQCADVDVLRLTRKQC